MFVVLRRASFYRNPEAPCRLASSFSPTTVPLKADGQRLVSPRVNSPKLDNVPQPDATYNIWGMPLQPSDALRCGLSSFAFTSVTRGAHATFSTKVSHTPSSPPLNATPSTKTVPDQPFPSPYQHSLPQKPPRSPITNWILASPTRTSVLLKVGDWLGYGSPKQVAGRRSKIIYTVCSEVALGPEKSFWYDTLSLPPSFQSWFTITNLHVWLATVRLRSLPPTHGRPFVQALIDNFFFDVEDRLRAILGKKASERLVTRQMKIFREQWAGLGLACDVALITGDIDMASAMWRNLLGARGAKGIAYPMPGDMYGNHSPTSGAPSDPSLQTSPKSEDPSSGGVTDFEGPAIDKYVMYPQLLLVLTSYLRRELVRLEHITDTTILGGKGVGMRESVFGPEPGTDMAAVPVGLKDSFKFGSVKDAARKISAELEGL